MLGSIDCMHWEWRNCLNAYKSQFKRGANNDLNVLYCSNLFDDVLDDVAPECPFTVNGHTYNRGYYLADGLKKHIGGTSTSTTTKDSEWENIDDLIKMWILGTLVNSMQEQVVATPGNAKNLWDHIKSFFHDKKDAWAINLDN
ncbi:hybrid signal transduction histidine kinase M [Tanacetum coccineum]